MTTIFPYVLLLLLTLSKTFQVESIYNSGNDDIMIASNRLHRGADRLHQRINPMLDGMRFPYNNQPRQNYYPIEPVEVEEEPETVYVNMNVESDEEDDVETKYVNLRINTD